MENYIGIDYGMGRSNINTETGIRYGVISCNSVGEALYDAQEFDYGDATCPKCGNACVDSHDTTVDVDAEWYEGKDYACVPCEYSFWSDEAFSDEPQGWTVADSDYKIIDCLHNDACIIESPYYTHAQFCSPCVPGACSLDSPMPEGPRCYCLGHDWFESGIAPYPVYSVESGLPVMPDNDTTSD